MAKPKRQVRLTTATYTNPDTKEKEVWIRAATKLGNKEVAASAPDEPGAIRALQDKLAKEQARADLRAEYPKSVEVAW